jgi:hypothetical protein
MWAPSDEVPSGIYFYRLKAANFCKPERWFFKNN